MNKVLSISISAYNQERYLDRCIESLIIPSVDELEIFVVNDGSKDRTSEIAHRWAEKYPQSVFAIDKENGHAGSCHNVTLKRATGKYYRILDGDDYYDTEALESFVQQLKHADADMVISTHVICSQHGAERVAPAEEVCGREMPLTEVDFTKHNLGRCYGMHGTTYRTAIVGGGNICLTEGVAQADAEYAHLPFRFCRTLLCLDLPVYMYQADNEGVHQSALVSVNRKEQVYKVTERVLNDYLAHQSDNANMRSAQRVTVGRCLASYYGIYISYFPNNAVDDERIRRMDEALLKHDAELYASLNNVYRLKWHFIKRYRATGHTQVRIMKFLEAINKLKKRLR